MAASLMFVGCTKDMVTSMSSLPITAESYAGDNSKAYISGLKAAWENGDQLRLTKVGVDNYDASISISYPSGTPSASAEATGFSTAKDEVIMAGYPLSLFSGKTIDATSTGTIIELPKVYTYSSEGNQKITAPMIGKVTIQEFDADQPNPNVLKMCNMCTLLKIKLDPPAAGHGAFTVDSIAVENVTSGGTPLCGNAKIVLTDADTSLTMQDAWSTSNNKVFLVFPEGDEVAINGTQYFYIPVPPLAASQTLRVHIHNSISNNWFRKEITTAQAVPGNAIATIPGPVTNDDDAAYTFYSYIENNNKNSYFNLGVNPDNTMKLQMEFMVVNHMDTSQYYSGARTGSSTTSPLWYGFSASRTDNKFRGYFCCTNSSSSSQYVTSGSIIREQDVKYRHTLEIKDSGSYRYYGEVKFERFDPITGAITTHTASTRAYPGGIDGLAADKGVSVSPICIYALGASGGNKQPQGMRLYAYRIWSNGTLIHNFVPAMNGSSQVGMYDMKTKSFVQGVGSFSVGND